MCKGEILSCMQVKIWMVMMTSMVAPSTVYGTTVLFMTNCALGHQRNQKMYR